MFAQINHMAIISPHYATLEKFYQAVFGLKPSQKTRPGAAATTGDGYVGLNLIPRRDGYVGGIDHFGLSVEDVEPVLARMQKKHKRANIVKRPSARPFAAYSGHDPDAEECAAFYRDVFELEPVNRPGAPGYHLTDGRVTLSLLPWSIPVFEGMSIKRPGPDHIGFHVEDLAEFKKHAAEIAGANPYLAPVPLGGSPESDVRKRLFEKSAGGKFQMSDPDGNWIDVTDE